MKRALKIVALILSAALCVAVASCGSGNNNNNNGNQNGNNGNQNGNNNGGNNGNNNNNNGNENRPQGSVLLGEAKSATPLGWQERDSQGIKLIQNGAESFAADFAVTAYTELGLGKNFTVSPLSVYMALSLAAECSAGNTRTQLLNTLGVSYGDLSEYFSDYFRSVNAEYVTYEGDLIGCVNLSNSIWFNSNLTPETQCINNLADRFYCSSYSADFLNDNLQANAAISEFVKNKTRGLIDQGFGLDTDTVFALINTLYLKDVWNGYGGDLPLKANCNFKCGDGQNKKVDFLIGDYERGRAYSTSTYRTFYATTYNGHRLTFIVPQEGYSVSDVFTAQNIKFAKDYKDSGWRDEKNRKEYYTSCKFPEYKADCSASLINLLMSKFGLTDLFNPLLADFSNVTAMPTYCSAVTHVAKLEVSKKGIEGAAVTVIAGNATAAPDEYVRVYEDFNVDRAFGFVLTDRYGNTLFSGAVNAV